MSTDGGDFGGRPALLHVPTSLADRVVDMVRSRPLVYISGALTDLPPDRRDVYLVFYEQLAHAVRTAGADPYVPHQASDPVRAPNLSPDEVDDLDRKAVTTAAMLVAYIGKPSLGVGAEIEMAYHMMKPIILLAEAGKSVSRLPRGNPAHPRLILFDSFDEACSSLERALIEEFEKFSRFPPLLHSHLRLAR